MANEKYNVIVPVIWKSKQDGKEHTSWKTVGSAFYNQKLGGYNIYLDFPVGVTKFIIAPDKGKDGGGGGGTPDDGGELPF